MPETKSDRDLVKQVLAGDQSAAAELVRRHEKRALSITYGFTHNRQEALDLVQDAFLRMFRNLERYREEYEFGTWFYRIVTNVAINHSRRKRILNWVPLSDLVGGTASDDVENELIETIDRKQVVHILRTAITALPEKQRAAIILFDIEGFSIKDTARVTGCSEGTVMSRLHYGRKRLKELLEESDLRDIYPSIADGDDG